MTDTPYTPETLAALPGVELSRIVAHDVMEWTCVSERDHLWLDSDGKERYILAHDWSASNDFRPDTDERHAAEVKRKCLERWPGEWHITQKKDISLVKFWSTKNGFFNFNLDDIGNLYLPDIPKQICIVAILAAQALKDGGR